MLRMLPGAVLNRGAVVARTAAAASHSYFHAGRCVAFRASSTMAMDCGSNLSSSARDRTWHVMRRRGEYAQTVREIASRGLSDPYLNISVATQKELDDLGDHMELYGKSGSAQRLRRKYFAKLRLEGQDVVEVGCGTGVVTRAIAAQGANKVVGVDPSTTFLKRAEAQAQNGFLCSIPNSAPIEYCQGDALRIPLEDNSVDLVLYHETLSHVPRDNLDEALSEARRVLRKGGLVSVFDNDFVSYDFFNGSNDPLRKVFEYYMEETVQDTYFMRKIPYLLEQAGFQERSPLQIFLDVEHNSGPAYSFAVKMLEYATDTGEISKELFSTFTNELHNRVETGNFVASYGHGHCTYRLP